MSETIEATGIATAILVTGGMLGDISVPAIIGVLVAKVSPDALFYSTFIGVLISSAIVVVMFIVAFIQKKKRRSPPPDFCKLNGHADQEEREGDILNNDSDNEVEDTVM